MATKKMKHHLEEKVKEAVRLLGADKVKALANDATKTRTLTPAKRKPGRPIKSLDWWTLAFWASRPFNGPITIRQWSRDLATVAVFDGKKLTADGFRDLARQVKEKFAADPKFEKRVHTRLREGISEVMHSVNTGEPIQSGFATGLAMLMAMRVGRAADPQMPMTKIMDRYELQRRRLH